MILQTLIDKLGVMNLFRVSGFPLSFLLFSSLSALGFAKTGEFPNFNELVSENSPAVVNISALGKKNNRIQSRSDQLDPFFERFFGGPGNRGRSSPQKRSMGSGFVISSDGYLLTNNHVVEHAETIIVRFNDRRELNARLIGSDPRSDLALLKVEARDLPKVVLGNSDDLKVGDWVLAIGSPFGFDYSVTAGIVSAKGRSVPNVKNENYVPFIQTDVAINPGNSGGPLFDLDGRVVGINSQIYSNSGGYMGVSFAIPIDVAMEVVEQLKSTGSVSRGYLGVRIQEVNRDLAESFMLDRPHGALVVDVGADSAAAKGGVLAGDIITRFNGIPINFSHELPHLVGRSRAGGIASIEVVRNGEELVLEVELGELKNTVDVKNDIVSDEIDAGPIGLKVEALGNEARDRLRIKGGVKVLKAVGPAADAGIVVGDVISRLNNVEVNDVESFRVAVKELPSGRSVPVLVVKRQGAIMFLALRVP